MARGLSLYVDQLFAGLIGLQYLPIISALRIHRNRREVSATQHYLTMNRSIRTCLWPAVPVSFPCPYGGGALYETDVLL